MGSSPPYPIGDDTAVISFTQAEWSCHLGLAWKLPKHVIDLNCELRLASNGLKLPAGQSLLGFCRWFGIEAGDAAVKDAIRNRIIKGWPFTPEEKEMILKYAGSDVDILALLFERIEPHLDYERALYRGDWSWVSALMENRGVPVNGPLLPPDRRSRHLERDARCAGAGTGKAGVYVKHNDGSYHFSFDHFDEYLKAEGIPWPLTEDGRLSTKAKVFEDMAKGHPSSRDCASSSMSATRCERWNWRSETTIAIARCCGPTRRRAAEPSRRRANGCSRRRCSCAI